MHQHLNLKQAYESMKLTTKKDRKKIKQQKEEKSRKEKQGGNVGRKEESLQYC